MTETRTVEDGEEGESGTIRFDDDPQRVSVFNRWYQEEWEPWAREASRKKKIQRLYHTLFALYQRFQREGELLELAWGHGQEPHHCQFNFPLLAHGKRVLVTSEKEPALRVLKDKIPEEIRSLCVSLLGGDSKALNELETTIKNIAEGMESRQPEII